MRKSIDKTLEYIDIQAKNDLEKGKMFELLMKMWLVEDAQTSQEYEEVWAWEDWARDRKNYPKNDLGIDLVAKRKNGDGFAAVQCKCYKEGVPINKEDMDSFLSLSANVEDFSELVLLETSRTSLGKNVLKTLKSRTVQSFRHIDYNTLRETDVDLLAYVQDKQVRKTPKKQLREHQQQALQKTCRGFEKADRGKIVMACGTGKTLVGLRIAEKLVAEAKKRVAEKRMVLVMVPSLALMAQTIRAWKNDAVKPFYAVSVCSDKTVGKAKNSGTEEDETQIPFNQLLVPVTTDAEQLAKWLGEKREEMIVVFSTYHSIEVISQAQRLYDCPQFDLIVCDEAHRTTGTTFFEKGESAFVKIHSNDNVDGKKRLYMTATPQVFGQKAKDKAKRMEGVETIASMDDVEKYGEVFYFLSFAEAVEKNLLCDYQVVILRVDEGMLSASKLKKGSDLLQLKAGETSKIVGCYKALTKKGIKNNLGSDEPMGRAILFTGRIADSKNIEQHFQPTIDEYKNELEQTERLENNLGVALRHVDGTMSSGERTARLSWLEGDLEENECRILTNARCLSEGVDLPALDAVIFMKPRNSNIDIVQSVGRVMRKAEGKQLGYIVLPIVAAPGVSAEAAIGSDDAFAAVWQTLNALRMHDERLEGEINRMGLGEDSDRVQVVDVDFASRAAMTSEIKDITPPPSKKKENLDKAQDAKYDQKKEREDGGQIFFFEKALYAAAAKKCGTREYWQQWAESVGRIAQQHIAQINQKLIAVDSKERVVFDKFLQEIRDDLNPEISASDAVEMLAQHIITKPVFETLFGTEGFVEQNAVSRAMSRVVAELNADLNIASEDKDSLDKMYASVRMRSQGIKTPAARQRLVLELYEKFFHKAFPLVVERLGIAYTPVEVVDFILHSCEDLLQQEFGTSLAKAGTSVLDPFTGTGTFVVRLLQSGIVPKERLRYKYSHEIYANEILLLAYYIAGVNIELAYHQAASDQQYRPFPGGVLTDTFYLTQGGEDLIAHYLPENSDRRTAQMEQPIRVIVGNPPYSIGQKSENDNAQNVKYPKLDKRVATTYAQRSTATLRKSLSDSYIRAFRWASDRIEDRGVIGFVTGAGWLDGTSADGMRACLAEEFSRIVVFNLRGDTKTQGERGRKENQNIFGASSRSSIAITLLVKNPEHEGAAQIEYADIGDYLSREAKLAKIADMHSVGEMQRRGAFKIVRPDAFHDWVNQRDPSFENHLALGRAKKNDLKSLAVFENYSLGIVSSRDAWCYHFSRKRLLANLQRMVAVYHGELERFAKEKFTPADADKLQSDSTKINWSRRLKKCLAMGQKISLDEKRVYTGSYRPFTKMPLYFDTGKTEEQKMRALVEEISDNPKLFPSATATNRIIATTGKGASVDFSCLMTDAVTSFDYIEKGKCFPLYVYDDYLRNGDSGGNGDAGKNTRHYAIVKKSLEHFRNHYSQPSIGEEDVFYYTYGLLHSRDYRQRYRHNLGKQMPRLPLVKRWENFQAYTKVGKLLGDLHVDYEKAPLYDTLHLRDTSNGKNGDENTGDKTLLKKDHPKGYFRVEKMRKRDKLGTTLIYNSNIAIEGIPERAYDYVVNGKPALNWVIERQQVKIDKASGIINDPNDYASELGDQQYPLKLFCRVVYVAMQTLELVEQLPKLELKD